LIPTTERQIFNLNVVFFQNKHDVKTVLKKLWHNSGKYTDLNSSRHSKSCGGHDLPKGSCPPLVKESQVQDQFVVLY